MAESTVDLVIKIVQMIIITAILLSFIRRKRNYGIQQTNWFIGIFLLAFLQGVAEIIIYIIKINILEPDQLSYFRFNELHTIPYSMAIFLIYLMAEYMDRQYPHPVRLATIFISWSSAMTILFIEIFRDYDIVFHDNIASHQFSSVVFESFQLMAMAYTCYIFYKSYQSTREQVHKKPSFWLFFATLTYCITIFYEILESLFNLKDIYGALTLGISFLILAYVYLRYPYFVFNVPTEIYRVILSTKDGLLIYSAKIHPKEQNSSDELLASGVSLILGVMKEALGSKSYLRYVIMDDRTLVVRRFGELIGFLITDHPTGMISSALDQFVKEFILTYGENFSIPADANLSRFSKTPNIIARCFPFVSIKDIEPLEIEEPSF